MLQPISDDVHLGQSVNPAENTDNVKSVDYVADFKNVYCLKIAAAYS